MRSIAITVLAGAALALAACSSREPSKFQTYDGPAVTQINVFKDARQMDLMHYGQHLASYEIDLGREPVGQKEREGDGRTPEGAYIIDRRNPNSRFHLSLGISYPEPSQRLRAEEAGDNPGGDIFIHGKGPDFADATGDWTEGCIAVTDDEIEEIYAMIGIGTPILILP